MSKVSEFVVHWIGPNNRRIKSTTETSQKICIIYLFILDIKQLRAITQATTTDAIMNILRKRRRKM